MSLAARRRRKAEERERCFFVENAGSITRRKRCPVRATRRYIFTTCITPSTRARLKSVHLNVFVLDQDLAFEVPQWLLVDAAVDHLLKDPAALREIVKQRIQELAAGA